MFLSLSPFFRVFSLSFAVCLQHDGVTTAFEKLTVKQSHAWEPEVYVCYQFQSVERKITNFSKSKFIEFRREFVDDMRLCKNVG